MSSKWEGSLTDFINHTPWKHRGILRYHLPTKDVESIDSIVERIQRDHVQRDYDKFYVEILDVGPPKGERNILRLSRRGKLVEDYRLDA